MCWSANTPTTFLCIASPRSIGAKAFILNALNRTAPKTPAKLAITDTEISLLDALSKDKDRKQQRETTLSHYLTKIAKLGGYLARASDPPPGNMVIWKGLSRLTDIELGAKLMGN